MFLFFVVVFLIPFIVGWYYTSNKVNQAPNMKDLKPSTLDGQIMECTKGVIVPLEDSDGTMTTIEAVVGEQYKVAGMMTDGTVALSVGEHYLLMDLENLVEYFVKVEEGE